LFLAELTSVPEGRLYFPKMDSDYLFYAEKPNQKVFRKILINSEWIEFKDFFVHIPTKKIIKEQYDWPAFHYIPSIIFSDIEKMKNNEIKPEKWLNILQNSGYVDESGNPKILKGTFNKILSYGKDGPVYEEITYECDGQAIINDLYQLLAPKLHKSKVPVLFGDSNCGKTTVISPFIKLLPSSKVATCGKSNGFEMSNFLNKLLVILDEATVNSVGLGRSQLLQITEGGALMNINRKHNDPITKTVNANITVMSNSLKWAQVVPGSEYHSVLVPETFGEIDTAFASRCNFYPFKSLDKKAEVGIKEYIERKEKGLVFLYLLVKSSNIDSTEVIDSIEDLRLIIEDFKNSKEFDILNN
jgi:hypothetical protein